ncbi:MAG: hypothetical protein H0U66_11875 [Gemmatimonadaceae bacterium]|nr:hypothetical protein [Gemmatimonadaceae bacterium]
MKKSSLYLPSLLAATLVSLCGAQAYAQVIASGSRIRVIQAGAALPTEGSLVAMSSDSISLHLGMSSTLLSMPMDSVRAVDLSRGRFTSFGTAARDGAIGLVVGVGVVALGGKLFCAHSGGDYCGLDAALLAVPFGVVGLVSGVAIARRHKTEHWKRVYDRPATALLIGPAPRGGFAVGLSIPFGSRAAQP